MCHCPSSYDFVDVEVAGTEVMVENPVDTVKLEVYVTDCEASVLFEDAGLDEVDWLLVIAPVDVTEVSDALDRIALKVDKVEDLIDALDEVGSGGGIVVLVLEVDCAEVESSVAVGGLTLITEYFVMVVVLADGETVISTVLVVSGPLKVDIMKSVVVD